jgi:hypothetical protein
LPNLFVKNWAKTGTTTKHHNTKRQPNTIDNTTTNTPKKKNTYTAPTMTVTQRSDPTSNQGSKDAYPASPLFLPKASPTGTTC